MEINVLKIALTSLAALVVASTTALAADLPSRRAPPVYVPPPPIPVFTWTGFYLGVNAGYAFDAKSNYTVYSADPALAGAGFSNYNNLRSDGFTGGGQIGYNYEFGAGPAGGIVVGVEADAAYTDLRHTTSNNGLYQAFGANETFASRTDFVGTVRGRVGYAFDRVLIYGTGGFAYGGVRNNAGFGFLNNNFAGTSDKLLTGYAYGGGIEYALPTASFLNFFNSSAVTIKGEFIHYDLGTSNFNLPNVNAFGYNVAVRTSGNLARAGLNFKFGDVSPAPVVARY